MMTPEINVGQNVGRALRVLIVEDSKVDVGLLLMALRTGGFQVAHQVVDTPASMRVALQHKEWDVITSDHAMPRFSGPAALAMTLELSPSVPFIIVSGEIDLNLAVGLIKAGAVDYVQKAELVRLVPVIERLLHDVQVRNEKHSGDLALLVSEIRYRRLFETAQDGILIVDAETGQIDDVNPFLLDLLGFSKEEYLGKKLWEVAAFKDSEASKSAFLELQNRGYIRYDNIPLHAVDGRSVEVEFVSNVYEVDQKKVIQCNIRDISVRREVEERLKRHYADLERRVQVRTAQVEALNKELETFNYSVSHDLQAPLRRITGFVTALERLCADKLNDKGIELLVEIRSSTLHMTTLIKALLKLSSTWDTEVQWVSTDLSSIAQLVATELQQAAPDRNVEFVIGEGISAAGDAAMLRVVLENLMQNAWKFTSLRDSARIEFGIKCTANNPPTYFVRDNGAGFDMKYADRLFGAFQRLHGEDEFPGTGIGLASVQRIIHRHGGHIWAESAVEQGATFYFNLEAGHHDGSVSAPPQAA
jgi:PAS domain S-box-containing protein